LLALNGKNSEGTVKKKQEINRKQIRNKSENLQKLQLVKEGQIIQITHLKKRENWNNWNPKKRDLRVILVSCV
jgi:hypothetical protein